MYRADTIDTSRVAFDIFFLVPFLIFFQQSVEVARTRRFESEGSGCRLEFAVTGKSSKWSEMETLRVSSFGAKLTIFQLNDRHIISNLTDRLCKP